MEPISIFICYRRGDTNEESEMIRLKLVDAKGAADRVLRVFRDREDSPIFEDFRRTITEEIIKCDIFILMVGPKWAGGFKNKKGKPDWVEEECRLAFLLGKPMIPICINDAKWENLPEFFDIYPEYARREPLNFSSNFLESDHEKRNNIASLLQVIDSTAKNCVVPERERKKELEGEVKRLGEENRQLLQDKVRLEGEKNSLEKEKSELRNIIETLEKKKSELRNIIETLEKEKEESKRFRRFVIPFAVAATAISVGAMFFLKDHWPAQTTDITNPPPTATAREPLKVSKGSDKQSNDADTSKRPQDEDSDPSEKTATSGAAKRQKASAAPKKQSRKTANTSAPNSPRRHQASNSTTDTSQNDNASPAPANNRVNDNRDTNQAPVHTFNPRASPKTTILEAPQSHRQQQINE